MDKDIKFGILISGLAVVGFLFYLFAYGLNIVT